MLELEVALARSRRVARHSQEVARRRAVVEEIRVAVGRKALPAAAMAAEQAQMAVRTAR